MHKHTSRFVNFCRCNLQLDVQATDYTYQSLSVCIIDCVYSLYAQYESTAKPVVKRYADLYMDGSVYSDGNTVSDLVSYIDNAGGPEEFAGPNYLGNKQQIGGVLKAEVCYNLAKKLKKLKIETMKQFADFDPEILEPIVLSVSGIGDAGLNYLFMLAGDPDRCKPDRHIHHCIKDACGEDLSNHEIQSLFYDSVRVLSQDYPQITVAMLDGIIWRKYQNAKNTNNR